MHYILYITTILEAARSDNEVVFYTYVYIHVYDAVHKQFLHILLTFKNILDFKKSPIMRK